MDTTLCYLIRGGRVIGVYTNKGIAWWWGKKLCAAVVIDGEETAEEAQVIANYRARQAELFPE